jgi:MoaA/NifB/PqqE/SkfB family radical SAM enzyme
MNFYHKPITKIEIEISSFCNAKCPQCVRESRNGDYSFFNQVNLSVDFFEIYYDAESIKDLKQLSFCGVVGDPAMNKHLLNVIRWFRKHNPRLYIEVSTNGGIQKPEWWAELASVIGSDGNTIFAIDGLEDTNHIYRREVKWSLMIENVKAYIAAGGLASWQFIPFKHNEHQVEEAKLMSERMGFKSFKIKKSQRDNFNQPQNQNNAVEHTDNPLYKHPSKKMDFTNMNAIDDYLSNVEIVCYVQQESSIYLSAEGLVFPCCHTASLGFLQDDFLPEGYDWIRDTNRNLDKDDISLYKKPLKEILLSKTFNDIKDSWHKNMTQGRNPICAAICGNDTKKIDFLKTDRSVEQTQRS